MRRISFRSLPVGGPVLRTPRTTPTDLLLGDDELLLLVHGYWNSEPQAFASYRRFMSNIGQPWAGRAAGVFWPGDGLTRDADARRRWFRVPGWATYFWQPQRADETARHLANLLSASCAARRSVAGRRGRVARPLAVSIVAHSMGCRIALGLLGRLRPVMLAGAKLRVRSVGLMAAAVPAYAIQERGDLEQALATAERTTVYRSRSDRTLRFAFRIGQVLERPFPLGWRSRGAIGRHGAGRAATREVEVDLDHGDYWPSLAIADDVRSQLGSAASATTGRRAGRRRAGARTLPSRRLGAI